MEFGVHPDLASLGEAEQVVRHVADAVAKLPFDMRRRLHHVVIHHGDETASAEKDAGFFVLYHANIAKRIAAHDLEETVFHESVHATLDKRYANSRAWRQAQNADDAFITRYAQNNPGKEDLAESALFAWAVLQYPGRLPGEVEAEVRRIMPHRLAFFAKLFGDQ